MIGVIILQVLLIYLYFRDRITTDEKIKSLTHEIRNAKCKIDGLNMRIDNIICTEQGQ